MIFKKVYVLLFLVAAIATSCETNENDSDELKLSELNVDFNFKFDGSEIDLNKSNKSTSRLIIDYIDNIQLTMKNNDLKTVIYEITMENNKLKFGKFRIEDSLGKRNGQWTSLDEAFNCPGNQELVDTCWSQECVEDAIGSQSANFSNGETISIHHTGMLGGVKICSNVQP